MKLKHVLIGISIIVVFLFYITLNSEQHNCMKDPEVMAKLHADSVAYRIKDSMYLQSNGIVLRVKQDPLWEYYQENSEGER